MFAAGAAEQESPAQPDPAAEAGPIPHQNGSSPAERPKPAGASTASGGLESEEEQTQPALSNKQRKLAAKREKQKAKTAAAPPVLSCSICHRKFQSRNQLFKHIGETGHAHSN